MNKDICNKWTTVTNKKEKSFKFEKKNNIKHHNSNNFNNNNTKKILCINIIEKGQCPYSHTCLYAHSLYDQKIEAIRKQAYDIINTTDKLNFKPGIELANTLIQLTNVCTNCIKHKCTGGYNCKYGVFDRNYQVCADDLKHGICYNVTCSNIHLTNKGLIPLNTNMAYDNMRNNIRYKLSDCNINDIPNGVLITDDFFTGVKLNDADIESDGAIEDIQNYLDNSSESDGSCNESIFC